MKCALGVCSIVVAAVLGCAGSDSSQGSSAGAGGSVGNAGAMNGNAGVGGTTGGAAVGGSSGNGQIAGGGSTAGAGATGGAVGGVGGSAGSSGAGAGGAAGGAAGNGNEDTPRVRFVGRIDDADPSAVAFQWSGTGAIARFSGDSVAVNLDGGQEFTAVVDGQVLDNIVASGDGVAIASGLAAGEHTVEIYRRVEAHGGVTTFRGFDFGGGALLPPPVAPNRRIEVIGDSITCGYGNEGTNPCGFTYETENHYMTYEAIAARAVGAELHTTAWSGKGVVCNYGDDPCADPFPDYYDRTLPNDAASLWDFSRWQADVVVVNLGTNDVSTTVDPTDQEFQAAYVAFLTRIRQHYAAALILCTCGPMLGGDDLTTVRNNIDAAITTLGDANIRSFNIETQTGEVGCDSHPSVAIHQQVADVLVAQLQTELGW